jgi:hypothetical protein
MEVKFFEDQRFRQDWMMALLFVAFFSIVSTLIVIENWFAEIVLVVALNGMILIVFSRLETRVEDDYVSVKFFPFHRRHRKIQIDEIKDFGAEKYSPIKEFGGWGLRWMPFSGKIAYNVSGNEGVRIKKKHGKEVMIGSQKPDELEAAIEEIEE